MAGVSGNISGAAGGGVRPRPRSTAGGESKTLLTVSGNGGADKPATTASASPDSAQAAKGEIRDILGVIYGLDDQKINGFVSEIETGGFSAAEVRNRLREKTLDGGSAEGAPTIGGQPNQNGDRLAELIQLLGGMGFSPAALSALGGTAGGAGLGGNPLGGLQSPGINALQQQVLAQPLLGGGVALGNLANVASTAGGSLAPIAGSLQLTNQIINQQNLGLGFLA